MTTTTTPTKHDQRRQAATAARLRWAAAADTWRALRSGSDNEAAIQIFAPILDAADRDLRAAERALRQGADAETLREMAAQAKALDDESCGSDEALYAQELLMAALLDECGWSWEDDEEFTSWALKATTPEIIDEALRRALLHSINHI